MGGQADSKTPNTETLIDISAFAQLKRLAGGSVSPMTEEQARECYLRNWSALDLGRMERAELALVRRLCTPPD